MGQEASLPQNGEDFEEQAKAPPSTSTAGPLGGVGGGTTTTGRNGRKFMNAILQRGHHDPSSNDGLMNGNGPIHTMEANEFSHSQQQQHQHHVQQHGAVSHAGPDHTRDERDAANSEMFSQLENQYYPQQPQNQQQQQTWTAHPIVGVLYEKTTPARKVKAATGRGAALINSMRNLSLGGALRPKQPKAVAQDWEKQWDEDDEEDDEDDEEEEEEEEIILGADEAAQAVPIPLHQQPSSPEHTIVPPAAASFPIDESPIKHTESLALQHLTDAGISTESEDGLEWDTNTGAEPTSDEEKPNMQMFLPMLRVLGKGSFGKVVLVQKRVGKERGQLFAMKILRKTHLVKRRQIERTRTERKVLSMVNHPFIMKLHYAFQSEDKLYLVLDYCPGGELFFHLSRFRRFPERVARFYSAELLLAIGHLHKRGIIYRDLKPENVLLDAEGHVKLGDFGLAKSGIVHPYDGAMSMCGTPEYMAPEVLSQSGHGFCVDYWGLGMIAYEMMTGLPPWYTTDRAKLFRKLKSAPLDIPTYFSPQAATCVSALLERDPRRRLGVAGIRSAMEHEFFRNISWRALYARRIDAPIRPCEGWKQPDAEQLLEGGDDLLSDSMNGAKMNSRDLDMATQNFDNQFTRMPVESEDDPHRQQELLDDAQIAAELRPDTFRGFSFDGHIAETSSAGPSRPAMHLTQSHALD